MALTRPTLAQLNTTITALNDPLTLINNGSTASNHDVGFVFNRDGGNTSNVAIYWDETNDQFTFAATSHSGAAGNIAISEYADVKVNDLTTTGELLIGDADKQFVHGDVGYQNKRYILYGTTTDGAETEIFVGGTASSRIPVPNNTTISYTVDIVARRTDTTDESAGWQLKGLADNYSGTVADVGDVYEVAIARDDTNWTVDVRASDSDNSLNIYVAGASSKTVKWLAVVKLLELTN
jgi:hypothetical protein